ncbi:hypothetical protein XENORESO_015838 [Xenotaenia resolanae]|uniref:Uncharacterized protein n=1 Tax=Xenotaenia resolanae TaxID=208358 RepID=A0ABV0W9Y9_9TELE
MRNKSKAFRPNNGRMSKVLRVYFGETCLSDDADSRIFRKSYSALRTDASETCAFLTRKVNLGRFSRSLQASRKFLTCWWRG